MTDDTTNTDGEPRTDGGTGIVAPDDETPTWRERKERTQGLSRLTYEYFERARREDQDLRQESSYVERDVLAFPTWPHETVRNIALTSFFVGMIIFLSATLPPHIANPANPTGTMVGQAELARLARALPPQVVLVLDGAYAEFGAVEPMFGAKPSKRRR